MSEITGAMAPAAGEQFTGVTAPAAGVQEIEYPTAADLEAMQYDEPEDTEPEPTIDEILGRETAQPQTVEPKGDDAPPAQNQPQSPDQTGSPNQQPELPENAAKAFSERLKAERVKIEREAREAAQREFQQMYGITPEEAQTLRIEKQARELMEKHPDQVKTIEFARDLVKMQMGNPQTPAQQQVQPAAQQQTTGSPDRAAWVENIKRQELEIKAVDPDFSFVDHYNTNPAFQAAVLAGGSVRDALAAEMRETAKTAQQIEAAKRSGKQEAVDAIRNSGSAAMAPVPNGKGQRQSEKPMSDDELRKFNDYVKMHGRAPNPYYHG